jgi:hypothetical protein
MFLSLIWQQLHLTVRALATGQRGINERLTSAYLSQLMDFRSEDLPVDMRDDFEEIYEEITRIKLDGEEESIIATISGMEPETASSIADQIFSLFDVATRKYFVERDPK